MVPKTILPVVLAGALAAGCMSTRLPAPPWPDEACVADPALVGTWKDHRLSQLGPAWVAVTFSPDCSYRTRMQLLWGRIVERGYYRVEREEIVFTGSSGTVFRWPFFLAGDRLTLEEAGEPETYRRVR